MWHRRIKEAAQVTQKNARDSSSFAILVAQWVNSGKMFLMVVSCTCLFASSSEIASAVTVIIVAVEKSFVDLDAM